MTMPNLVNRRQFEVIVELSVNNSQIHYLKLIGLLLLTNVLF